jgi:hypothetical protein
MPLTAVADVVACLHWSPGQTLSAALEAWSLSALGK